MSIPKIIIPILVIITMFGGYYLRAAFTQPSTDITLTNTSTDEGEKLECIVDGIRCKGTAEFFTGLYEGVEGINSIITYASDRKAVFTYNPDIISPDSIRSIMEAEIEFDDGTSMQVFKCQSMD